MAATKSNVPVIFAILVVGVAAVTSILAVSQGYLSQTSTQTITVFQSKTVTDLASVTLIFSCAGCQPSNVSYTYYGAVRNGTSLSALTTNFAGRANSTYTFVANTNLVASGTWSVSWTMYESGTGGILEVQAFFNSVQVSEMKAPPSSSPLTGSVTVQVA